MQRGRQGDINRVDLRVSDQLFVASDRFGNSVLTATPSGARGVAAADGGDLHPGSRLQVSDQTACDPASTQNAKTHHGLRGERTQTER